MMNLTKRLAAIVMVLALAIPVVAISEEGTYADFTVNKTVLNKGDTLVISWKADTSVVSEDSINVDFYLEDNATVGGIDFAALAVNNDFSTDEAEGTYSLPIDGSFYGEGYVQINYLKTGTTYPILTQKIPITINPPADAVPYFDFSVSKHPSEWKTGDVIEFTWDHNVPRTVETMGLTCYAMNGSLAVVGDFLNATEPGTYQYTVPDLSEVALLRIILDVISPRETGIRETGYAYSYVPVQDDEPTVAPDDPDTVAIYMDKSVYNAGDTMEFDVLVNEEVVDVETLSCEIYVEREDAGFDSDCMYSSIVYLDTFYLGGEGHFSERINKDFAGKGGVKVNYRRIGSEDWESIEVPLTVNNANPPVEYFNVSYSKSPDTWAAGDEIEITWDYTDALSGDQTEFLFGALNADQTWKGEPLVVTTPGTYKYTIKEGVKWHAVRFLGMTTSYATVELYGVYGNEPFDVVPTEAPTTAPTAAPTTVPSAAPTNAPTAAPTSAPTNPVELNLEEITIGVKQSVNTVKVKDNSAKSAVAVTWTSANEKIAKVDADGKITGVKKGKTTITAADADGNSDTVEVTVVAKDKGVKKIKLNKKKATIKQGEKLALKATLTPANAKNKKIIWTSSNTSVATVNAKGKVKAVGVGEATITAISSSGKTATCKVTVTGAKVKKIVIEGKKKMKVGETQTLIANILPEFAENKDLKWKSSSKKIATVDENGMVTALKKGTVTITAIARDGSKVKATFIIKIKK